MGRSFKYLGLVAIVLVSLVVRVILLDKVPAGISHDEVDFIVNSKSVFLRFTDLTGRWFPLSFTTPPGVQAKSELLYLLLAPFVGPFPFSLLLAKVPFALINALLVGVLYLITEKLVGKREALFTGIVAAFNPWMIYFGRTSFEAPVAMFFYFLSFYLMLVLKGRRILLIFIPLLLAFSCYMGTKLLFIPFVMITSSYVWLFINKKKYLINYIILFILSLLIFTIFSLSLSNHSETKVRMREIGTPFAKEISDVVDRQRKIALVSPLSDIFINKISVFTDEILEKYLNAFSTRLLFIDNSEYGVLSLPGHGFFYYLDLAFIILGTCFLFVRNRRFLYLLLSLLILAPLPAAFNQLDTSYPLRASFIFPLLIIMSGLGFFYFWEIGSHKKIRLGIRVFLIVVYSLGILSFGHSYFMNIPVNSSENFFFSSREVSKYIALADRPVIVAKDQPEEFFREYIFYRNILNRDNIPAIEKAYRTGNFKFKKVAFVKCESVSGISDKYSYIISEDCKKLNKKAFENKLTSSVIVQLSDSGSLLRIYNDDVCGKYELQSYIKDLRLVDLDIDKMEEEKFCKKFIIRYK